VRWNEIFYKKMTKLFYSEKCNRLDPTKFQLEN
jgi:hypothetical protein